MVLARHVLLLLWACGLAGCVVLPADDGSRTVVGFVVLRLPPPQKSADDDRADAVRAVSVGLSFASADAGSFVTLGYSDTTLIQARGSSCLRFEFR